MKKYFLCMVALLSLAIVACESDDTAPAPAVRPTFDLIDAQPDVTSAVVAANIESKGEAPISEVGFSYQEAGGEYVDVVCTNFKDGLARQTLTGLKPDTEYRWYCYAVLGGERFNASLSKTFRTLKEGEVGGSRTLTSAWIETSWVTIPQTSGEVALSRVRGLKPIPGIGWNIALRRTLTSAWVETFLFAAGLTPSKVALSRVRGLKHGY